MRLVVGLGNPGREYEGTRHNIGFDVVERLAGQAGVSFRRSWKARSRVAEIGLAGERVVLAKPQMYMNRSGLALAKLLRLHPVKLEEVIVVMDDADLPPGRIRIRAQGSAGHHNGLKSILGTLGDDRFIRLRMGIGEKPPGADMAHYVLSRFTAEERDLMQEAVGEAAEAVAFLFEHGLEKAMNEFNGKK